MDVPKPIGDEKVVYSGKIFEIVRQPMKVGDMVVEFEFVRRSPGVRLLIVRGDEILLVREFRSELNGFDYRLPGGKVFDCVKDYKRALSENKDLLDCALDAARKECLEETGLVAKSVRHVHTAHCGATVVWDMLYFVVDEFSESQGGQDLEDGEVIYPEWKTSDEVRQMCVNGDIREGRTVGFLLRFLSGHKFA